MCLYTEIPDKQDATDKNTLSPFDRLPGVSKTGRLYFSVYSQDLKYLVLRIWNSALIQMKVSD
jgi:hypothetical protein